MHLVIIIVILTAEMIYYQFVYCQESFDGQMTEDNIEIGISNSSGFRKLLPSEVQDYLASIQ